MSATSLIAAPSVTDWIDALSALVLGLAAAGFAVYQWRASGFRPRLRSELDGPGTALRIEIENRGRASSTIDHVAVTDAGRLALDPAVAFRGLADGFRPRMLPAWSTMTLIAERPGGASFPPGAQVKATWGGKDHWDEPSPVDVSFAGLESVLPPAG